VPINNFKVGESYRQSDYRELRIFSCKPIRDVCLLGLAWTPEGAAGFGARVLAVFENLNAVDENVSDADGILVGLLEGSTVGDCLRIENHYVRKHALLDKSAVIQAEVCSRQSREATHGLR
jgi:hypothetical protein